jgi:hypothetical protein
MGLVGDRVMDDKYTSKSAPKRHVASAAPGRCSSFVEHHDLAGCLICTPFTAACVTSGMLRRARRSTSGPIAGHFWRLKKTQGKAPQMEASVSGAPSLALVSRARPAATQATLSKTLPHVPSLKSAQMSIAAVAELCLEPCAGRMLYQIVDGKTGPVPRTAPDAPRVLC